MLNSQLTFVLADDAHTEIVFMQFLGERLPFSSVVSVMIVLTALNCFDSSHCFEISLPTSGSPSDNFKATRDHFHTSFIEPGQP